MFLYQSTVPQFVRMLENLDKWLEKGVAHSKSKSFDVSVLLQSRLIADQYSLIQQIQSACDSAKFAAAYLTGTEAPKHPDTETTLDEVRARIQKCTAYLKAFKPSDFEGAEKRVVSPAWAQGKSFNATDYIVSAAIPNFYFHITTAYSILRNNGVELGKMDYMGPVTFRDA